MTHTYSINGMTCTGCVAKVKNQIEQHPDVTQADISLEQNQAVISMDKHIPVATLQGLFGQGSKYAIDEAAQPTMQTEHTTVVADEKSKLETFKPLILIFLFITGVSAISSIEGAQIDLMKWMNYFMAGFFLTFSFFKFLDLRAFADSYSMYDLLAKRVRAYGFVYPFIELALGLAYLMHFEPQITYAATIAVMSFSSLGVIQSVLNKKEIKCACLGSVFNLPMTTVTIIEDLLMVAMAVFMLWTI